METDRNHRFGVFGGDFEDTNAVQREVESLYPGARAFNGEESLPRGKNLLDDPSVGERVERMKEGLLERTLKKEEAAARATRLEALKAAVARDKTRRASQDIPAKPSANAKLTRASGRAK